MAIGAIGTALAAVPWNKVIEHAPNVIEQASRLWTRARRPRTDIPDVGELADESRGVDADHLTRMMQAIEASIDTLNAEMTEAGKLIKDLSEANGALLKVVRRQQLLIYTASAMAAISLIVSSATLLR